MTPMIQLKIEPLTWKWDMFTFLPHCFDEDVSQYLADSESSDNEYKQEIETKSECSFWLTAPASVVYNCGDCNKDFKYRHELKMHARKHSRLHTIHAKGVTVPCRKFKKRIKREPISSSDSESPVPPPRKKPKSRSFEKIHRNLFNSYPEKPNAYLESIPQTTLHTLRYDFKLATTQVPIHTINQATSKTPEGTPEYNDINDGECSKTDGVNKSFSIKDMFPSPILQTRVEQNMKYQCRVCYSRFFTRGALIVHGRQHDHLRTKKCKICGKTFIKTDCLKNHMNRHKKLGFYRNIHFEAQNKDSISEHTLSKVPILEIKTEQETTERPENQEHIFSKVSKMIYNCRVCHKSFAFRGDLVKHGSVHDDLRTMKCHICGKTFVMKDSLKNHINRHGNSFRMATTSHSVRSNKLSTIKKAKSTSKECEVCGKKISNNANLHKHVTRMHSDTFLYKCDYCRARFQNTVDLDKHLERHKKRRPYKCDNCCKLFATSIELHVHFKRTHPDENLLAFHCDKCSKRCATNDELAKHVRVHEGLKPHKCGVCDKAFRTMSGRDAHAWGCYGII